MSATDAAHGAPLDALVVRLPTRQALAAALHEVVAEAAGRSFVRAWPTRLRARLDGGRAVLDGEVRPLPLHDGRPDGWWVVLDGRAFVVSRHSPGVVAPDHAPRRVVFRAAVARVVPFGPRRQAEERLSVARVATDSAERSFHLAAAHCRSRVTFGVPLHRHQAVRFQLAELRAALEASRRLHEAAADALARGEDARRLAAVAALKAGRVARRAAEDCAALHGAASYVVDHPAAQQVRDALVLAEAIGPEDALLAEIARA